MGADMRMTAWKENRLLFVEATRNVTGERERERTDDLLFSVVTPPASRNLAKNNNLEVARTLLSSTVWGVRLWKMFCKMFSESFPCLQPYGIILQRGSAFSDFARLLFSSPLSWRRWWGGRWGLSWPWRRRGCRRAPWPTSASRPTKSRARERRNCSGINYLKKFHRLSKRSDLIGPICYTLEEVCEIFPF